MLETEVIHHGSRTPAEPLTALQAGPLSMVFEPQRAILRYVRLGGKEVVRAVFAAVRDRNWDTVEPEVSNLEVATAAGGFRVSFDAVCKRREIDFIWRGNIEGDAQGTVRFSMDGRARSTFLRNRIGFCVLHPIEGCAGEPCTIELADGRSQRSEFPREISGKNPFTDLKAIAHRAPGTDVQVEVRFEGDLFETEDHRNWTDASFKTFCTPLSLPFPVEVKAGAAIAQAVTLRLLGTPEAGAPAPGGEGAPSGVDLAVLEGQAGPVPQLGLGMASHGAPPSPRELARLRSLGLSHLRVDLGLADLSYRRALEGAAREAEALGIGLEAAIFLTDAAEEELDWLLKELKSLRPRVAAFLVFHQGEKTTSERWVQLAREKLSSFDPRAPVGSGTNGDFFELNRQPPAVEASDLIAYSINPQVHAFDDRSLVETLGVQGMTVACARRFCGELPLRITPVTLKPRFFANATGPVPVPKPGELPSAVDPRQMSLFGAGWTLASLKYLAEGSVESVTYYETTGWRGVMETEKGSPLPKRFPSIPGGVFPLYHVLADALEFAGGVVVPAQSSEPLRVEGMALRKEGRLRILLANLGPGEETVRVHLPAAARDLRLKRLDATNAVAAMASPEDFRAAPGAAAEGSPRETIEVQLLPYAVARIDGEEEGLP